MNDYIAVVRRRKWIIVSCTVFLALAGSVYAYSKGVTTQASVQVAIQYVQPPTAAGGVAGSQNASQDARFLANQAAFARTAPVLLSATKLAQKHGVSIDAGQLAKSSSVTPSATADILSFVVHNKKRQASRVLAHAYAQAFVNARWGQIDATYGTQASALRRQIKTLTRQINDPNTSRTEVRSLRPQLVQTLKVYSPLAAFVRQDKLSTSVQPSTAGVAHVKSSPSRYALIGAFLGLVFGLIAAFIWEAIDRGRTTSSDVSGTLNLPVLASIPTPPRSLSSENRLATLEPNEPSAEAYRLLAVRLELLCATTGRRALLITSALDSEGKSTTAANVSVALARMGKSVVMVDGDLLRPTAARYFGAEAAPGMFELLTGELEVDDVTVEVPLPGPGIAGGSLRVIAAGRVTDDPTGLLASDRLDRVIGEIRQEADYVIIDSTPLLTVSHAMVVSSRADALVVIARADRLTPEVSWNLQETLKALPAMALGVVVTAADATQSYYGYGYGYGSIPNGGGPADNANGLPGGLRVPGMGATTLNDPS